MNFPGLKTTQIPVTTTGKFTTGYLVVKKLAENVFVLDEKFSAINNSTIPYLDYESWKKVSGIIISEFEVPFKFWGLADICPN